MVNENIVKSRESKHRNLEPTWRYQGNTYLKLWKINIKKGSFSLNIMFVKLLTTEYHLSVNFDILGDATGPEHFVL